MSLSREALAQWMWQHYGDPSDTWEGLNETSRGIYLDDADDLALQFKLPLDTSTPNVTRCRCGHPVGDHRNGTDACYGQAPTPRGMQPCKCKKAVAA
jgi:hypothetical protein